jgi:putative ABC transport system substrate-binding protein
MSKAKRIALGLLGFGLLAAAFAVEAQHQRKIPRIAVLTSVAEDRAPQILDAFHRGLREVGYVEGQTIAIERRSSGDRPGRLAELAAEFVKLRVDVIVASSNTAVAAAKKATATIPIVMVLASDPVGLGFVESLAQPGRNITGLTSQATDLTAKRLQLLKEAVPNLSRVAVLVDPAEPDRLDQARHMQAAARSLKLDVQLVEVRSAGELDAAFAAVARHGAEGVLYGASAMFLSQRARLAQHALKRRLPTLCFAPPYVESGCLMSYSADIVDLYRRAAYFVDRILKGAKPGDLPVEQPTKFRLAINLKTAKALGITLSPNIVTLADEVIQ